MRRFAVLLMLLAACGGGSAATTSTTAPAPPTTTAAPRPTVPPAPEAAEAAAAILSDPTDLSVAVAARAMGETGDRRWVPYLVDLVRLTGEPAAFGTTQAALAALTGLAPPAEDGDTYALYGAWMYNEAVDPGEAYLAWKATLYALIDPSFGTMLLGVDDPVLASRIQWGGVRRAGIPELDHQETIPVGDAFYMEPDELTFGAVVNGEARAYPHRILDHHELANDMLGGQPVALVNCTLCRTGVLYSRTVDGEELYFQTSGLLINSNKIMVDLQTESLWEQLTGVAIAGPLRGTELDRFFVTVTTWEDWVASHPDTDVLAIPPPLYNYSYEPGDAYRGYYESAELWFPAFSAPDVFAAKDEVATLDVDGARLAVGVEALAEAGPQVLEVGDRRVAAIPSAGGARFYDAEGVSGAAELEGAAAGEGSLVLADGRELPRVQSGQSFWFAWYGAFPDTAWWPARQG